MHITLVVAGFAALGLVVASASFGFSLGMASSGAARSADSQSPRTAPGTSRCQRVNVRSSKVTFTA